MTDTQRVVILIALVGVLFASVAVGTVAAQSAPDCSTVTYNGDGTETNPYEVGNVDQLQCIEEQGLDANYVQVSDIDASGTSAWNGGRGFDPIGDAVTTFTGTFDGADYTISGLTIDRAGTPSVGLFASVKLALFENVSLSNIDITGGDNVGALVGTNGRFVGGGGPVRTQNGSIITESHATGKVSGNDDEDVGGDGDAITVGGLVGNNNGGGNVIESYAAADVSGDITVGGLVGFNDGGNVTESYATGNVSGTLVGNVGGLVGSNLEGTVRESYATGDVSASGDSNGAGGLVGGNNRGAVTESYATGDVSGDNGVGGLVGGSSGAPGGDIINSYATGDVSGNRSVGGLVGGTVAQTVEKSYATGSVTGSGRFVGGLVGSNGGTVEDSYWDTVTTGQPTSDGGTGLITSEMTGTAATSNMLGFDFMSTWETVTNPDDYPILAWQELPPTASFTLSTPMPTVNESVTFDASGSSDRDGSIQTYEWDFDGDGTTDVTRTNPLATHTYTNAGTFAVTLTVTDDDGTTGTTTETVEVRSEALFSEPLPGFNEPPTNTQEIDSMLYEDIDGDGDGLDPSQTVNLWSELVVNPGGFDDLTQEQVDALDWNGDGQLTPADAVSLWTEQVLN